MDWFAMIFTLLGVSLLAQQERTGWLVATAGSVAWIFFAVSVGSVALVWLNLVLIVLNIVGWSAWGQE